MLSARAGSRNFRHPSPFTRSSTLSRSLPHESSSRHPNIAILATLFTFSPQSARADEGCILTSDNCVLCATPDGCATLECPRKPFEIVC